MRPLATGARARTAIGSAQRYRQHPADAIHSTCNTSNNLTAYDLSVANTLKHVRYALLVSVAPAFAQACASLVARPRHTRHVSSITTAMLLN